MANYQTPGVYIEEIASLPGTIVGVATAILAVFAGCVGLAGRSGLAPAACCQHGDDRHAQQRRDLKAACLVQQRQRGKCHGQDGHHPHRQAFGPPDTPA